MLYQQFLKTASALPQNNAIFYDYKYYSYDEILNIINHYSRYLEEYTHQCFLIYCSKSIHNIAWQLACNKTANIFINADINTPLSRIDHMLQVTEPTWILTDPDVNLTIYQYQVIEQINSAVLWKKIEPSSINFNQQVTHIYFSSGSTGIPKAILLNDFPIIDVVLAQADMINLNSNSCFAWLLSPSFDASLSDIYSTLLSGACLYICEFKMNQIKTLYQYFNDHNITHTDLSPSILAILKPHLLPTLKAVIFGGEIAKEDIIKEWHDHDINMFNAYGPTETTICSSLKKVDHYWTANNVGKPLKGVFYHLALNENNIHELHISGTHLAIGYDQSILNDLKFYMKDNIRYYITGDLFTIDNEGDYLFMGRVDRQFKYNGILISPEEIENYCMQAGCVEVLCKLEDKLTVYFSGNMDTNTIKDFVSKKIPSNMLPQKWVAVDSLTKNINGKVQL